MYKVLTHKMTIQIIIILEWRSLNILFEQANIYFSSLPSEFKLPLSICICIGIQCVWLKTESKPNKRIQCFSVLFLALITICDWQMYWHILLFLQSQCFHMTYIFQIISCRWIINQLSGEFYRLQRIRSLNKQNLTCHMISHMIIVHVTVRVICPITLFSMTLHFKGECVLYRCISNSS